MAGGYGRRPRRRRSGQSDREETGGRGTPVWAQHPDTGAYGHTVAVRVPAGRAAEMRAMAAAAQTLHIQGTECRFYPMTATRPASTRIEQGPRQVDAVHEAAMACNPGVEGGTQYGFVVRRIPLNGGGETRDRASKTEALRHGGAEAWRPDPEADGPYTCSHTAAGIEKSIWKVRKDGGVGQASGVTEDMGRDDANGMARPWVGRE